MALTVILFRVFGRLIRTARLFREDIIMAAAILPLLVRMGCVHVILLDGTNNQALDGDLSPGEISHRMTGSKLVLPARIIYAML